MAIPFMPQLLSTMLPQLMGQSQVAPPAPPIGGLLGGGGQAVSQPLSKPMGPPAGVLDSSARPEEQGGFGGAVNGFFGNLDNNLQSPSKLLGLGLLNRMDPRLGGAGLIGMGLLGQRQ